MSQGNDEANRYGPANQYGPATAWTPPGPQVPPGYQMPPAFDPVTGQPLPPGPPAYSAVDPYAPQPPAYPLTYPGHAPPGYPGQPPPGYQFVPMYPLVPVRPPKPGGAIAAAVLAFVQAGFVLIGSVFMFSGASFSTNGDRNRYSSEFTVIGFVLLVVGGLLIAGGTTMLNRRSTLLGVGGLLSIALSVYFVIRLTDFAFGLAVWVPIIYAVLPILAIAFSMGSDVRSWIKSPADVR